MTSTEKVIKVTHLINYLGPAGKEMGIVKLIRHLPAEEFESTIVVMNGLRYEKDDPRFSRLKVVQCNLPPDSNPLNILKLAGKLRGLKPDILHTHSWSTLIEGIIAGKLAGIPVIIHGEHGTFPQKPYQLKLQNYFWDKADGVLAVSSELRQRLSEATGFNAGKIEVILNGVDPEVFGKDAGLKKQFRQEFGFTDDDIIIGAVGRLNRVKNLPMLLRGFAKIKPKFEKAHLVHVGAGAKHTHQTELARMKKMAEELGIGERVHFLGRQSNMKMIYNGMDLFVLTSRSEGCSNVIQEALFCGLPVIATRVGGNPELVQHEYNGLLVPDDDDAALADALEKVLTSPDLRSLLAGNAFEDAQKRFSLDKMIEGYRDYYRKLFWQKGKMS
ncbi:MAG: glycosyltransferase [Calditrichia bacterium]